MEEKTLHISKEVIDNLSIEQLVDLKLDVEELVEELDNLIEMCDEEIDSEN